MKRVLVTRSPGQASTLADALTARGLDVLNIPAIEIAPPTDEYKALDAALADIANYRWLIFTSANAIEHIALRLATLKLTLPASIQIASIGAATTRAIEAAGWKVTLQPETAVADALAEAMLPHATEGKLLFPRAEQGRDTLPLILRQAGADLTLVSAYRSVLPETSIAQMQQHSESIDAVCFTSSSSVVNLASILSRAGVMLRPDVVLASIGPVTTATMLHAGMQPRIETSVASVEALANAVATYLNRAQ